MKEQSSTIKNPLTVIAIFAGTAEISGTAILPLLEAESQQTYIWFLMLFPLILIIFFFLTLNFNHKVLYAPSDFTNEDNFVNILKKASIEETISNIQENLEDNQINKEDKNASPLTTNTDTKMPTSEKSNKDINQEKTTPTETIGEINRRRMQEAQMAELLVLNKLEKELKAPIQRDMVINIGRSKMMFDGVVHVDNNLTGIEVRYMTSKNSYSSSVWANLTNRFEGLYQSLSDHQKKSFSVILAVATNQNIEEIRSVVSSKMTNLSFPVQIRVYDFAALRDEAFQI